MGYTNCQKRIEELERQLTETHQHIAVALRELQEHVKAIDKRLDASTYLGSHTQPLPLHNDQS